MEDPSLPYELHDVMFVESGGGEQRGGSDLAGRLAGSRSLPRPSLDSGQLGNPPTLTEGAMLKLGLG